MRSLSVVKLKPVSNHPTCMLDGLGSETVRTLLFESSNHTLYDAVLLETVERDEFLLQIIAGHQRGIVSGTAYQTIVRTLQKRFCDLSKHTKLMDEGLFHADSAVADLPLQLKCQPRDSRVWQSITKAKLAQPYLPHQTRQRSVAQRSSGC